MNKVHISTMTGKLESFKAINTNTSTNPFCIKMNSAKKTTICSVCYSHSMLNTYRKNMAPALQRNSDLLSSRPLEEGEIPKVLEAFIRIHAHGELINQQHLANYVVIARSNPHCIFALWTKRKDIIKKYFREHDKPANLILIYSNPNIGTILDGLPEYFDRTFNNVPEEQDIERQNCAGQKCKNCMLCYTPNNGVSVIVEKVKSYGKKG